MDTKPVPLPRRGQSQPKSKPVPLPRKLGARNGETMGVVPEAETDPDDLSSLPDASSYVQPTPKRGTINIFQLANLLDDPFNDFDTEFNSNSAQQKEVSQVPEQEVESPVLLSNISFPSPFRDLDEETRRRISSCTYSSTSSTSTEDYSSDHYMEPPPARRVCSEGTKPSQSQGRSVLINRASRTGSGRSSQLPPLQDENEEEEDGKVVHNHHPLGKVVSCPPAPLAGEDEEYEPIAATSFSQSARLPSSPGFPSNNNFHQNKRVTLPTPNLNSFNFNQGQDKKLQNSFAQNKLKFESRLDSEKTSPPIMLRGGNGRGRSGTSTSDTESTDSFQFANSNDGKRSSSPRQVHEYDDVTIEDGTVVFLDNMENAAALSDETNNNSSISLSSRNSVTLSLIAEFDPLLHSRSVGRKSPAPPPPSHGPKPGTSFSSSGSEPESEPTPPQRSSDSCLDLNDGEQHRYEYIDTDAEEGDGRSSASNSNNEETPPQMQALEQEHQPPYSFPVDFKANFRKQPQPLEEEDEAEAQEEYEPVGESTSASPPPPPPKKPERFLLSISPESPTTSGSPPVTTVSSQLVPEGNAAAGNSFFRRFSSKFRLNSIREETPFCRKCGSEHGEKDRCKFCPPYRENIVFSTNLYKASGLGRKEWTQRRVVLQPRGIPGKGRFTFYNDKSEEVSELLLEKIAVISKKESSPSSSSSSQLNLQYFELGLVHYKQNTLVLAAGDEDERGKWMNKYIEAHTTLIPPHLRSSFDRGGWVFLKETVASSEWRPGWLLLRQRSLVYAYQGGEEFWEMDLRKARTIELTGKEEEARCPFVDNGDVLTLDLCAKLLYIQTESSRVTRDWEKAVKSAASRNGRHFSEMQLTLENVPVVVDKCIDFLYAHGTLAEGIYRQSGSNTRIAQLLADFQKDAWAVTISPKEFSAHDVAGTLKRFFRTLPEPLVTTQLYPEWIKAAGLSDQSAKEAEYIRLLESLPQLNYNILKKLMCHLYAVHELHEKNLMPLINLAPIWGPTLMSVDNGNSSGLSYDSACAECEVVKELIQGYYTLFRVQEVERDRERRMHLALENFHLGSLRRKCSGDMKIWIYVWTKDETSATNVELTPFSTAAGIVAKILENSQVRNAEHVALHEVICGESLERILHPGEKVIDTVLRWSLWNIEDRKDNYLILKKNLLYPRLVQYAKEPHMVGSEVKVADSKSKSYRKGHLHFSQATLKLFKDAKCNVEHYSWKIEDIVWYVGTESRRSPPTKWTFTLANKTYHLKRSKEEPFFGWVIGTSTEEELHRWLGALVVGEHPEGLYPNVML